MDSAYLERRKKIYTENDFDLIEDCPLCHSRFYEHYYNVEAEGNDYCEENNIKKIVPVVKCLSCGFVYAREVLNAAGSDKFWEKYSSQQHDTDDEDVRKRNEMYRLEYEFICRFMRNDKHKKDILDVGCAEGRFLDYFAKDHNCYGTEVGDEAIQISKKKHKVFQGELPQISTEQKFDLIIFRGVIQYFKRPKEYFNKAIDLLKPGGLIFITSTPVADAFCHQLYKEKFNLPVCAVACNGFTISVLKDFFETRGMELAGEKSFYEETPYANIEKDIEKVNTAIQQKMNGREIDSKSPAFWGNMMTLVFKKII